MKVRAVEASRTALLNELSPDTLVDMMREHTGSFTDVAMTPALAKALLEYNTHNRPIRASRVTNFVRIIAEGRWVNTGEPIILSRVALNEGQHRLNAVVGSGVTIPIDVRFGIAEKAYEVTGTGATRSPGDTLAIMGVKGANGVAAALRMLIVYDKGLATTSGLRWRMGNDIIVAAHLRWPDCVDAHTMMHGFFSAKDGYSASAGAFTYLALRHKNESTVREFLLAVSTGVVSSVHDPARLLREKLRNDPLLRHSTREAALIKLALFIIAWLAWLNGDRPKSIAWSPGTAFPRIPGLKL